MRKLRERSGGSLSLQMCNRLVRDRQIARYVAAHDDDESALLPAQRVGEPFLLSLLERFPAAEKIIKKIDGAEKFTLGSLHLSDVPGLLT